MAKDRHWFLKEISAERDRQDEKFGEQRHHPLQWFSIIGEEYGEMCKAYNEYTFDEQFAHIEEMQREAIQVAASCVAMLECIDAVARDGMVP